MKRSTDRTLTTHVGSLPRPVDLLDMMKEKVSGESYDHGVFAERVQTAVAEIVRQQVESGIDIPTDGEQGKLGFSAYVSERLSGFDARPGATDADLFSEEVAAFPEYYERYFGEAMHGGVGHLILFFSQKSTKLVIIFFKFTKQTVLINFIDFNF